MTTTKSLLGRKSRFLVTMNHSSEQLASSRPPFTNLWRTLQWWVEPMLAYFDDRVTNAFAEGITNKIKVMKRRSYGFRDPVRYPHKVLLSCRRRSR